MEKLLRTMEECEKMPEWQHRWKSVTVKDMYPQEEREKCLECKQTFGSRVPHFPCDWVHGDVAASSDATTSNKIKGEVNEMPISEKEFQDLAGKPRGGFGADPNSLSQRTFRALPTEGGVTADEVIETVGEDAKKVKNALNALCYDGKIKKVVKKYDENGEAYYKQNPEYVQKQEGSGAEEETASEEDVDAEE